MVEAEASVGPATSSITWAEMCRADRVTTSRGRSGAPKIFFRPRSCRRSRDAVLAAVPLWADSETPIAYLPAFPTLRRTRSPAYRTPLPL